MSVTRLLIFAGILVVSPIVFTSVAAAVCGDGAIDSSEDCDDGDTDFESGEFCGTDCTTVSCGHASGSTGTRPIATDALFALKAVVGIESCDSCVCDTDGSGQATATDVLRILSSAVGQEISLNCGACADLVRHGVLLLTSVVPIIPSARQAMLDEREALEAQGLTVAEDGSFVGWPTSPAKGWIVRMGDRLETSDTDGAFTLSVSESESTVGSVAHPGQPDTPIFELRMDELARVGEPPFELEMELASGGPCGMNADPNFPDPVTCDEILGASTAGRHHNHDHGHAGHDHDSGDSDVDPRESDRDRAKAEGPTSAASEFDPPDAIEERDLGTYPLGNQNCCRDFDGTFSLRRGAAAEGTLFDYFGSTCHAKVLDNCCGNELGSLTAAAKDAIGELERVSCLHNHKGRYCQEVVRGDVSVSVDGELVPSLSYERPVNLGERVDMVVHNNACYGTTFIGKLFDEISGRFEGDFVSEELQRALHFSGSDPNFTYSADREFVYAVPNCAESVSGTESDLYVLSADGSAVAVLFTLLRENLWRCVDDDRVFNGDTSPVSPPDEDCPMYHKSGAHPCDGSADPGDPCGHGVVEPYTLCGDGVLELGEDCETGDDTACPGECVGCQCPTSICGNDFVEPGEECDGNGSLSGCAAFSCIDCVCMECGNGRKDSAEDCDGSDLGGATCEDFDRVSGTLRCDEACAYDFTECVTPECGNGIREGQEECDGDDAAACGGSECGLECSCLEGLCGNGVIDPGEECEPGMPAECRADCTLPACGDEIVDLGEQCDSNDFFCAGGSCLSDCNCDNLCATDGECTGGDLCLLERCVAPCMGPADCTAGELCHVPGVTTNQEFQPGCGPAMDGGGPIGSRCTAGDQCGSYSCYDPSGECTQFCYGGPGGDEDCPGGACLDVIGGTNFGLCATACTREGDCDGDQVCHLSADFSENEYQGFCAQAAGVGDFGDSCSANSECDTELCMTPPPTQAFCSTSDECGVGEVCSPFFICTLPFCTQFCESDSDCGGSQPTCRPTNFLTPLGGDPGIVNFCGP